MSLILTHINKFGIVHASDSNLTLDDGNVARGKKTFEIPHLNSGLAIAGTYTIGGTDFEKWVLDFIEQQASTGSRTLGEFSHALKSRLELEMSSSEKKDGILLHIAGYAKDEQESHPEFWFVRNIRGMDQNTGEYFDGGEFEVNEEFWSRDYKKLGGAAAFTSGVGWLYANGLTAGRISVMVLSEMLQHLFARLRRLPDSGFQPPRSLSEVEALVKVQMQVIILLYGLTFSSAPPIGGEVQTLPIPNPDSRGTPGTHSK